YASWLTHLPEADRQRVLAAANSEERLKVVRELKERDWVESLPPGRREEWSKAPEAERKRLAERWRMEERTRQEEWADAKRWDAVARERPMGPMGQERFREEVNTFVNSRLMPMLSAEEKARLRPRDGDARPNPGAYLATVVELSDRHPVLALEPKYT